ASMGNSGIHELAYPAAYSTRVFSVGATMMNGMRWQDSGVFGFGTAGSNYGNWVDVSAPSGIFVVAPRYGRVGVAHPAYYHLNDCSYSHQVAFGGTSSASPIVSGIAALCRAVRPSLLGEDLAEVLRRTAQDTPPAGYDDSTGFGIVRAKQALDYLGAGT